MQSVQLLVLLTCFFVRIDGLDFNFFFGDSVEIADPKAAKKLEKNKQTDLSDGSLNTVVYYAYCPQNLLCHLGINAPEKVISCYPEGWNKTDEFMQAREEYCSYDIRKQFNGIWGNLFEVQAYFLNNGDDPAYQEKRSSYDCMIRVTRDLNGDGGCGNPFATRYQLYVKE